MVVTRSGKDTNDDEGHQVFRSFDLSKEEFQRILKERKAESKRLAEMKRLEGLKIIGERKSRTGVEPLEYFSKEIWCFVLDELTPPDKANLWQVHPLFPDLMERNQIRDILFPLILDHKKGIVQKYFANLSCMLNLPLIELRRVSKSMRDAVEKWYEDDLLTLTNTRTKTARRDYSSWDSYKKPIRFSMTFDEEKLRKILDIEKPFRIFKRDIAVSLLKPIRGNTALVEDAQHQYFNLFVANVTKALEQVGDQIWRFKFYYRDTVEFGVPYTQACSLLKKWLGLLPNVKLIDIYFYDDHRRCSHAERIANSSLWNEGFPTLHALKRLDLHSLLASNAVELVADAIVSANPQIKMVTSNGPSEYQFMSRPSIKALNLEFCRLGIHPCPMLFKEIATAVGSFNWNLKMLELHFFDMSVSVNSLIRFLNKFPNLNSVYVSNFSVKFSNEEIDFLRLPNLIHFGIVLTKVMRRKYDRKAHFFFSLQFLLHSSNLESLTWTNYFYDLRESLRRRIQLYEIGHPEGMLDFGGGYKDLKESNLWDAFPKLQNICVQSKEERPIATMAIQTFRKSRGFLSSLE